MTKAKIKPIMNIPQDGKSHRLAHMTTGIRYGTGNWSVKHYATQIIYVNNGFVALDGGGYRSETTLSRLNFYLKPMGIKITEENHIWHVNFNNDITLFYDGLVVGGPDNFIMSGCVYDIEIIRKRDKLLQYLESEVKIFQVLPDKYVFDICEALDYPNVGLAIETLDHVHILNDFRKLCHTRLPDIKELVMK